MGEKVICSECEKESNDFRLIDGRPICRICIYQDTEAIPIYPIGKVVDTRRIELLPSQKRFLYKIEEEKYLTIIYYFHKSREVKSRFNRGLDGKEVGVFASRTPARLTPIGITEVELEKVEGTTLYVCGLDALSGSPVLDIKLGFQALRR
jgi:tRNA (Thr-GGU) A37 N-methylase